MLTITVDSKLQVESLPHDLESNAGFSSDGNIITSTSDFGAFWTTVASKFSNNTKVIFDISELFTTFILFRY